MKRLLLGTMLTFLLMTCTHANVLQTHETTMSATPARITVTPGQSFTITIIVNNINNLNGWQVALKYNASIVTCTTAWVPEDDVFANYTPIAVAPILNDPTIDGYNYSQYGRGLLSGSVNVSQGVLCMFNFTCQELGSTPLQLSTQLNPIRFGSIYNPTSAYSELLDPDQNEMLFTAEDCFVDNGPQPILTIVPTPGGTTDPQPGNYSNINGANVSATAIPENSYAFDHWLLDGYNAGSTNPIIILMTANHTLEPVFTQANYSLTIVDVTGGETSIPSGTYTYAAGYTVQITATADSGYVLSYWVLDGFNAGSTDPMLVIMNGNHTLMPIFLSTSYAYVYIRADGSIDPVGVPLSTLDNTTYDLAGDISSMMTVQRNNISILGNGHSLQGTGSGDGIRLIGVNNVSVTDINIRGFDDGIDLLGSSQDTVSESNITANSGLGISLYNSCNNTIRGNNIIANKGEGIHLDYSSNCNSIFGNNIEDNSIRGIYIDSSSGNLVYHNNVVNNTNQVYVAAHGYSPDNSWDNGMEGNYWSNYIGTDSDADGIGDTPHVIDLNNIDHFPLLGTFSTFNTPQGYSVNILSNSTITDFNYSSFPSKISFNVEGEHGTNGFCELTIPHILMDVDRMEVVIDNGDTPVLYSNLTLRDNMTHRWILFSYGHTAHAVVVQEDWTPPIIVLLCPEDKPYSTPDIPLNFTVNEQTSWEGYSLDGSANVTASGNQTLYHVPDGLHSIVVYANDTAGNMGSSDMVFFAVDTTPPGVALVVQIPPGGSVLPGGTVAINVTVIDNVTKVKSVNLNYTYANASGTFSELISMTNLQGDFWNATIPGFPNDTNVTYTIIAEDYAGNTITTQSELNYQYSVVPEHSPLVVAPLLAVWSLVAMVLAKRRAMGKNRINETQVRRI